VWGWVDRDKLAPELGGRWRPTTPAVGRVDPVRPAPPVNRSAWSVVLRRARAGTPDGPEDSRREDSGYPFGYSQVKAVQQVCGQCLAPPDTRPSRRFCQGAEHIELVRNVTRH
jgi:hypothetical protein